MKKPDTQTAMSNLINQVRQTIPFDSPESDLCADSENCQGCSLKLLEYLDMELSDWQLKLEMGYKPNFEELSKLGRTSQKVFTALQRNGLV